MDKENLLGRLRTIKNNYALVQLSVVLAWQHDALEVFERTLEIVDDHSKTESFACISHVFRSDELLKHATDQFREAVLRNCLKETFDLVKTYGEDHGQKVQIQAAPWYRFLRIVRNCLSHEMKLKFRKNDLKQLPVSWRGLTIDVLLQDKPLPKRDFLSTKRAVELIDEVIQYIEQSVK